MAVSNGHFKADRLIEFLRSLIKEPQPLSAVLLLYPFFLERRQSIVIPFSEGIGNHLYRHPDHRSEDAVE